MAEQIRHVDLFSGIGGFSLAAHWAGYRTEVFCERDDFCRKVLAKHWPGVPVVGDIRDFDGRSHAGADLLTGGFPCQPYSCAGKRLGDGDDRALWPEMLRVITEVHPRWIVAENVAGFIDMALDGVLADLEAKGYETGTVVLPACAVNAPHRRDRVWIVARNADRRDERKERSLRAKDSIPIGVREAMADSASFGSGTSRQEINESRRTNGIGGSRPSISDANRQPSGWATKPWRQRGIWQPEPGLGRVADGLPGRMDGHFDAEPNIPRVATGIPNRVPRLKALGNAIVPQVAYRILQAIQYVDEGARHG